MQTCTHITHITTPTHKLFKRKSVQIDVILGCCDGVQTLANFSQVRHLEERYHTTFFIDIQYNQFESTGDTDELVVQLMRHHYALANYIYRLQLTS